MRNTTNKNKWKTEPVLKIVAQEIKASPDNLTRAFSKIAQRTDSTQAAVNFAWYAGGLRELVGKQFATASPKVKFVNRKNSPVKPAKNSSLIYEKQISSKTVDGVRVVTVKQFYAV